VLSEEDLGNGNAASLARVTRPNHGTDLGVSLREAHIYRATAHQHQDRRLLGRLRHALDEALLHSGERQVQPINLLPLQSLIQPQEQYDGVRRACRFDRFRDRGRGTGGRVAAGDEPRVLHVALQHLKRRRGNAGRAEVIAKQRRGVVRVEPDDGEGRDFGFGQGESVAVVLQQDDPVLRGFQSQVLVLLGADLVRADVAVPVVSRGAVEEPQPHPDGEEVVEGSVDVLLCDLPLLESIGSVLLHVVAAVHVHS
jgi:hypothetical protein